MYIVYNKRLILLIQIPFQTTCILIGGGNIQVANSQAAKTY